jgi:hypothetical protein
MANATTSISVIRRVFYIHTIPKIGERSNIKASVFIRGSQEMAPYAIREKLISVMLLMHVCVRQ